MKQHNNRHPVTDALGHLDGEHIISCMCEDVTPHTAVSRISLCRRLAVAAACVTLAVTVGAAALLPLMRESDPTLPETSHSDTAAEDEREEYPFVKLQVLSYDEADDSTEDDADLNSEITIDANNYFRNSNLILRFDCADGERVVITSHNAVSPLSEELANTLAALEQLNDPEGDRNAEADEAMRRKLERKLYMLQRKYQAQQRRFGMIEVDDFTYMWSVPQNPDEYEIIDFTIYNAEDKVVGAGSICIGIRHAYCMYQLRTAVLGSERFDTPLTAEEATGYLDSLHATAEEAYAAMDFTPNSETEGYALARSAVTDILNAELPDPTRRDSCHYGAGNCDFYWFTFNEANAPHTMRRFFLFSDGSYVEVATEGAADYDDMLYQLFEAQEVIREDFADLSIPLTDGRILSFVKEAYTDPVYGFERTKWVAVIIDPSSVTV